MKKNDLILIASVSAIAVSSAFLGGLQLGKKWAQKKVIKGDKILEAVKAAFQVEGPIEGSWIELKRVPVQKFAIKMDTYRGGITRLEDEELVQYEFIADAHTGSILDIYRLA